MLIQNNLVISGSWKFRFINDGSFYLKPPFDKKTNAQISPENINFFSVKFMLADSGARSILVDLGIGTLPNNIFTRKEKDRHTLIMDKLKQYGISKISAIFFSHLHIDHIGNYLEFNESEILKNFPDIPCYVSRLEWEFRTSRYPEADEIYKKYYNALKNNIQLTEEGQEVLPGIITKYIGGHTPGHQTILFKTEENSICYTGDLIAMESQIAKNRSLPFDFDPEYSKHSRELLLKQGFEEQWILAMNHAPHVNFKLLEKTKKNE